MIKSNEKRSLRIRGHRTSVALESPFWVGVDKLAHARGVSVPELCAIIEQGKPDDQSLASALRCAVLTFVMDQGKGRSI